jgi:hypothetical protein
MMASIVPGLKAVGVDWRVDLVPHPEHGPRTCSVEALVTTTSLTGQKASPRITSDQALRIARLDAETAYRDLSQYRILLSLETDGWHIDYELRDPEVQGGGPHYIIDADSGAIRSKRYDQ